MSQDLDILFEIDLSPNGKKELFKDVDQFQHWLDVEKAFWNWGDSLNRADDEAFRFLNGFKNRLNQFQSHVDALRRFGPNSIEYKQHKNELMRYLSESFKMGHLIHSSMPQAKFVKDQANINPVVATYILKYFIERKFEAYPTLRKKQFEGAIAALLFEFNVTKNVAKAEKTALEDLKNEWQDNFNSFKKTFDETVRSSNETLSSVKSQKDLQVATFNEMLQKSSVDYHKLVEDTKKHFKEIEDLYQKNLALHSSISYWEEKSKDHFSLVKWFSFGVVGTFVIVGLGLFFTVKEFVGNDTLQTVQLWKITLILLVATIGVWATRVLVRLLLSNIHLGSEAKERRTMLLTYLALLQEGKLPEGDVRHLILQALFRPATTGIVRDDGVPPFMAEWLKRATGND